ncbi:MAG: ATP-binding protein [Rhodospirillaceae bacterium]
MPETISRATRTHRFLILLFPAYVLLDWISFPHPHQAASVTSWTPLSGLGLFVLFRWGWKGLPLLFGARLFCDLVIRQGDAALPTVLWADAVVMISALLAWIAFRRPLKFEFAEPSLRRTLTFIAVAVGAALLMSLTYDVAMGKVGGGAWTEFVLIWFRRFVGDFIGILTVFPCLAIIEDWHGPNDPPSRLSTVNAVQAILVAAIAAVLFGWPEIDEFKTFYLLFIPMVWVSVTDGLVGAALVVFITQVALFGTISLVAAHPPGDYGTTHLMVITQVLTGLLLGTVVAERQRLQAVLRDSKASLMSVFDVVPDAMVTVHGDGRVRSLNPAAVWLFGLERDGGAGLKLDALLPELDLVQVRPRCVVETHAQRRDGRLVPVEVALDWTHQESGPMMALMARDISDRKSQEAELAGKQAELTLVSRRSITGELAAVMAHEINQPLTAIVNYIGVCQALAADGGQRELLTETLGKVARQAKRSSEIIRHLRRFLSQGDGMPTANALDKVADEAVTLIASDIRKAGVAVRVSIPAGLPTVLVDRVQIQQVLHNLIRNGIDAMVEAGTAAPTISVQAHIADGDPGEVTVTVADNGPGLSVEARGTLFTPFHTVKASGMGLGLSISRSIIEAHSGRLWFEPGQSGGAVFRFTLPIASTERDVS